MHVSFTNIAIAAGVCGLLPNVLGDNLPDLSTIPPSSGHTDPASMLIPRGDLCGNGSTKKSPGFPSEAGKSKLRDAYSKLKLEEGADIVVRPLKSGADNTEGTIFDVLMESPSGTFGKNLPESLYKDGCRSDNEEVMGLIVQTRKDLAEVNFVCCFRK
ncbi:uncharacterized protein K452DRAFT_362104 [Aplosporella prunicola CBS 121167]|uniref:Uncharacterized protein n=1 Tax=Aplosporella prunicola CBS 121167 TaxID=1176127 RepID=A0A6A6B1E8_9PEZI|nr:uncharacterized protein K452DRAFT_362104 [Aplosporella prunicola CBS 121167]KAF2137054.1 hypothetical protein K452DRAFT_362104 [Aplosporella prunicola CBS 121167]